MVSLTRLNILAFALWLTSCSSVSQVDHSWVSKAVEHRTGHEVIWQRNCESYELAQGLGESLLQMPLTAETAAQVALLSNSEIQATFEEIGIAYADLVEACLMQNPVVGGGVRFPNKNLLATNWEVGLTFSVIDLLKMPLRKRVAKVNLTRKSLEVADKAVSLIAEVKTAFYKYQAEECRIKFLKTIHACRDLEGKIAKKQYASGNINLLKLMEYRVVAHEALVSVQEAEITCYERREELNRLLGLSCEHFDWTAEELLPPLPSEEIAVEDGEQHLLCNRLDLQAARMNIVQLAREGALYQWWTYTEMSAGVSNEYESEHFNVFGPVVALSIPVFNWGQADKLRLISQIRQSQHEYLDLEKQALSEYRQARMNMKDSREALKDYEAYVLPTHRAIVEETLRLYNVMNTGVYDLLESKVHELENQIAYQESLKHYWMFKAQLEHAYGMKIEKQGERDCYVY